MILLAAAVLVAPGVVQAAGTAAWWAMEFRLDVAGFVRGAAAMSATMLIARGRMGDGPGAGEPRRRARARVRPV